MKLRTILSYTGLCFMLMGVALVPVLSHAADTSPAATGTTTGSAATSSTSSSGSKKLEWSSIVTGQKKVRMISPSGDILDSGMDALAPLDMPMISLPDIKLDADTIKDPKKSAELLKKALYIPTTVEKQRELTNAEVQQIRLNQKRVVDQVAAYALTYGAKSDANADNFDARKKKALEFLPSAEDARDDVGVLNGATLGILAEMNKLLSLTATRAVLMSGDNLNSAGGLGGGI